MMDMRLHINLIILFIGTLADLLTFHECQKSLQCDFTIFADFKKES